MAESADKDEQVAPGGIAVKAGLTADGGAELTGSVSSDIFRLAFGRRHARNLLEARMAISIAEKEARGEPLTEREAFVFEVLEKEYKRRRERSAAMLDRAMEALPDMKRQMKALPASGEQHPTSDEWFSRVIRDAEDISDEDVRELYARVLAGELARPGTFSRKTLSVLRDLERDVAKVFEATTNLLLDGYCLPFFFGEPKIYTELGIKMADLQTLQEYGLLVDAAPVTPGSVVIPLPDGIVVIANNDYLLVVRAMAGSEINLPVIVLTAVGRELAVLPARRPDIVILRQLAARIASCTRRFEEVTVRWRHRDDSEEHEFDPPVSIRRSQDARASTSE